MKEKIKSPKFWGMLSVLLASLVAFFTIDETSVQIVSLIIAAIDVIVYVVAESYVEGSAQYGKLEWKYCIRTIDAIARRVQNLEKSHEED